MFYKQQHGRGTEVSRPSLLLALLTACYTRPASGLPSAMSSGRPRLSRTLRAGIDAQALVERGEQVADAEPGSSPDVHAVLAGGAVDLTALDGPAADHDRPAARPVIAAAVLVDARRAAELAHPHDDGVLPHAAVVQILDQGAHALVEAGAVAVLERVEDVGVVVPAAEVDLDGR